MAQLASGDPNCANGGASITDGSGATAYACTGAIGATGPQGPAGDTGPQGPAGAGITSLDDLNGLACENGTGVTSIVPAPPGTGPPGSFIIECNVPTPGSNAPPGTTQTSPILVDPAPNDPTQLEANGIDGIGAGCTANTSFTETGTLTAGQVVWYEFSLGETTSICQDEISVSPSDSGGNPGVGMELFTTTAVNRVPGAEVTGGPGPIRFATGPDDPVAATWLVGVRWIGANPGSYTLTIGTVSCPCTTVGP